MSVCQAKYVYRTEEHLRRWFPRGLVRSVQSTNLVNKNGFVKCLLSNRGVEYIIKLLIWRRGRQLAWLEMNLHTHNMHDR